MKTTLTPEATSFERRMAENRRAAIIADGDTPPSIEELILAERDESAAAAAAAVSASMAETERLPFAIEAIKRHLPLFRHSQPWAIEREAKKIIGFEDLKTGCRHLWESSQASARASGGTGMPWSD